MLLQSTDCVKTEINYKYNIYLNREININCLTI